MILNEQQVQLRDTLSSFFGEKLNSDYLRKSLESGNKHDPKLWKEILELGLFEYFSTASGDDASSFIDLGIIASLAGQNLMPEALPDYLYSGPYLLSRISKTDHAKVAAAFGESFFADLASSKSLVCFAGLGEKQAKLNKDKIAFDSDFVIGAQRSGYLICVLCEKGQKQVVLLKLEKQALKCDSQETVDRSLRLNKVKIQNANAVILESLDGNHVSSEYYALISSMLGGAASKALNLALEHTKSRKQFDKPIASFQAIQHQLADMYLRVEASQALASFACFTADKSREQLKLSAESALRYTREACLEVVEKSIQVHGGIGFTWEYDLHFYLRRIQALNALTCFIVSKEKEDEFINLLALN